MHIYKHAHSKNTYTHTHTNAQTRYTNLVAHNSIARAHNHTATLNDAIGLPWLHGSGALLCSGGMGENREAVLCVVVCVCG